MGVASDTQIPFPFPHPFHHLLCVKILLAEALLATPLSGSICPLQSSSTDGALLLAGNKPSGGLFPKRAPCQLSSILLERFTLLPILRCKTRKVAGFCLTGQATNCLCSLLWHLISNKIKIFIN